MAAERTQFSIPNSHFTIGPRRAGILLFISSESIVFLAVIAMYVTGQGYHVGPTPQENLSAGRMIFFSVALWLSSATIARCPAQVERGNQRGMRRWLGATIILGAIFLVGEAAEWSDLYVNSITAA